MIKNGYHFIIQNNIIELTAWVGAFFLFAFLSPSPQPHFNLCPLDAMGLEFCPGCGLGRSVTYLFHGHFSESWHMHYLGIPAAAMLGGRIIYLFRRIIKNQKRQLL
jgi:hypothetical protein